MDQQRSPAHGSTELTDELRACLRELVSNSEHSIPPEHAERLIAMGLATRWAGRLAITLAGRRAAYADSEP
jgi:hypothetical protein